MNGPDREHRSIAIRSDRLALLDGLRVIAAIAVMLYHAELAFGALGAFSRGYLFVDFFFLLSGFVLALSAEPKMGSGWGTVEFLKARIARLWPMTAAGVLIGVGGALAIGGHENVAGLALLGLLMIPAVLGSGQLFPLNGPQWSLFLELVANTAHGLVLRRLGSGWLLAIAAVAGIALAETTLHFGSNTLGPFSFNWWWAIPRLIFSYTLGVWFGRRWLLGQHKPIVSWELALALPLLCVVALNQAPGSIAAGDIVLVTLLFPSCFWLAATCTTPAGPGRWLGQLGAISFPLYAVHDPVLEVVAHFGKGKPMMVLGICVSVGCAWLLERGASALSMRRRQLGLGMAAQAA